MTRPVRMRFADGRWHFQHGPIDLIVHADGDAAAVAAATEDAWGRLSPLLATLVTELELLRADCRDLACTGAAPKGPVARRMFTACLDPALRFDLFVTSMAAVAGSVADTLIAAFARPGIERAYVNNGGDIALYLADGAHLTTGIVPDANRPAVRARARVRADHPVRGIATSGWRGRSQSLGIADSVTVLARTAAQADAAATLIANHVDIEHRAIVRREADDVRPGSDLGRRLVTVAVGALPPGSVATALARGAHFAGRMRAAGLIEEAALCLQGHWRHVSAAQPCIALAGSNTTEPMLEHA